MLAGDFFEKHKGETCLIVGNGPNLTLTPPEWFDYPAFAINRMFKYGTDWQPTYFVGVDEPLWQIYRDEIVSAYFNVPKFMPSTYAHKYAVPNQVIFEHFHSSGYYVGGHLPTQPEALTKHGITYQRVLGAVFQIAMYMGFAKMLIIGMQHKPYDDAHFWQDGDPRHPFNGGDEALNIWFDEYRHWAHMGKAEILNISADTYVPAEIIPRDDWRKYATAQAQE